MEHFKETQYGFEWGAVQITRVASHKGMVIIGIGKAGELDHKHELTLYVSPTGRRMRVFRKNKDELK